MDLLCINLHLVMLVDMYDKPREESGENTILMFPHR